MEAVVPEPRRGETLGGGGLTGAAERARGAEAGVVDQDDQNVGRAARWTKITDGRVFGVGIFGVVSGQADGLPVRNRQNAALKRFVWSSSGGLCLSRGARPVAF